MKYEVGYIVACLENYEIMKHEYELAYMDLMKELSELDKNIISLGINYGDRVQSSRISDTTYEMYARVVPLGYIGVIKKNGMDFFEFYREKKKNRQGSNCFYYVTDIQDYKQVD